MKYTSKTFSVPVEGDAYREGWERIFGKKDPPDSPRERPVLCTCGAPLMKDGWCHDCAAWRNA